MPPRKTVTSEKGEQELLPPASAGDLLAQLAEDARVKFQLDWRPVKAGTFTIAGAGVRDVADGYLYDEESVRCGWINYQTGEGAVDAVVLRRRREWKMRWEYDAAEAVRLAGEAIGPLRVEKFP